MKVPSLDKRSTPSPTKIVSRFGIIGKYISAEQALTDLDIYFNRVALLQKGTYLG